MSFKRKRDDRVDSTRPLCSLLWQRRKNDCFSAPLHLHIDADWSFPLFPFLFRSISFCFCWDWFFVSYALALACALFHWLIDWIKLIKQYIGHTRNTQRLIKLFRRISRRSVERDEYQIDQHSSDDKARDLSKNVSRRERRTWQGEFRLERMKFNLILLSLTSSGIVLTSEI